MNKTGKSIDKNQFGIFEIKDEQTHQQFLLRATSGVDLEYRFSPSSSLLLRSNFNFFLNNLYKETSKITENPLSFGIQIGWKTYW
jgi:hypothetical protein